MSTYFIYIKAGPHDNVMTSAFQASREVSRELGTSCYICYIFYIHLTILTKAGPHDNVMTSAFQASLEVSRELGTSCYICLHILYTSDYPH